MENIDQAACGAKGAIQPSPGQRPGILTSSRFSAEGAIQTVAAELNRAFSTSNVFGQLPRALPWARLNEAFGLRIKVAREHVISDGGIGAVLIEAETDPFG